MSHMYFLSAVKMLLRFGIPADPSLTCVSFRYNPILNIVVRGDSKPIPKIVLKLVKFSRNEFPNSFPISPHAIES